MPVFPLDPLNDKAKPAFRNPAGCKQWLSQLQLTNLSLAQGSVRTQIDELNRLPMKAKDRLEVLEALHDPVAMLQTDFSKRMLGKKLPLADEEFNTLLALAGLWGSMLNGYLRCLEAGTTGDNSLASKEAVLLHHALQYCELHMIEFLRAGCEPDAKSWQRLHALYALAESRNLHLQVIPAKAPRLATSIRTLYVKTLLLHRARLLGLSRSQWQIVERWLDLWGNDNFSVELRCSISRDDAPPLAVDLAGTTGLLPVLDTTPAKPSMRFLAMVPLSKLIRVKTILLQQGQTPKQLELGEELSSKDCTDLLSRLHARWCERKTESLADTLRDVPALRLCIGLENIYAHISGKPFKKASNSPLADNEAQKQIETFGRVLDETDRSNLQQLGFVAEEWLVEDDGLLSGRLLRRSGAGGRLGLNQIVSVHKADTTAYKLGVVTAVNHTRTGLYISLRYLPGSPQALIVRGEASGNLGSGNAAALLLPEMPNLRIPASLLIPRDWYQAGRQLEMVMPDNQKKKVAVGISVEKGNDYERISFTAK